MFKTLQRFHEVVPFCAIILGLGLFHFASLGCYVWSPSGQPTLGPEWQDGGLCGHWADNQCPGASIERHPLPGLLTLSNFKCGMFDCKVYDPKCERKREESLGCWFDVCLM